ncbi:MAG: Phosphatidylinositol kinase [uncultured Thiotrichaceae bacterium]|uniref:Phosphatidylinositol kinase n=1 Tax=uncultured Thiotrichaceae bacterium TaxID=298394 RepID=A0A6S6TMW8_9GAMM|nr:MAG: Phosphatidylinositol kinase [uncultured Thiotrichaceae bacterium]
MAFSISEYLSQRIATSKEIQAATGLNQTAVARQLKQLGDRIIKIANGRSPQYALTRNAFGGDDKLHLAMVDTHGNTAFVALIRPLAPGGFFVTPLTGIPKVLLGEQGNGLYEDLPYFLYDLAPQGFLGRQIAAEISKQSSDFPSDPRHWNSSHIGRYLIANGDDLPGNFKLGIQTTIRVRRDAEKITENDYPRLAESVMSGAIPGSSTGGEQPKFTAYCAERLSHVIVKFSPKGNDKIAQRWRDILITEYNATKALQAKQFPAATTRLIEKGDRLFLESQRFDRVGEHGRMPMLSLQAIDAEFTGLASNWNKVSLKLYQQKLLSQEDHFTINALWHFGRLINNTDMHLGNLSLGINKETFSLLPIYDMCSMGFAPHSNGEISPYSYTPPDLSSAREAETTIALKMARDFWHRVASDNRISEELRTYLAKSNPLNQ